MNSMFFKFSTAVGLFLGATNVFATDLQLEDLDLRAAHQRRDALQVSDFNPIMGNAQNNLSQKKSIEPELTLEEAREALKALRDGFCDEGVEVDSVAVTNSSGGDGGTQFAVTGVLKPRQIIRAAATWNDWKAPPNFEDKEVLMLMREINSSFPIRHLPQQYVELVKTDFYTMGPLTTTLSRCILDGDNDSAIRMYTQNKNGVATLMNMSLFSQALDALPALSPFAKKLDQEIAKQPHKFSGKVYRGALHSPLEILMMAQKAAYANETGPSSVFYLPNFLSTSTERSKCYFTPWEAAAAREGKSLQNVLFEIDLSEYNERSTVIQPGQSEYDEAECLLSCYNIYQWMGYTYDNDTKIPTIQLKAVNPEFAPEARTTKVSPTWIQKKGESARTRKMGPETIDSFLKILIDSFNRNVDLKVLEGPKLRLNP